MTNVQNRAPKDHLSCPYGIDQTMKWPAVSRRVTSDLKCEFRKRHSWIHVFLFFSFFFKKFGSIQREEVRRRVLNQKYCRDVNSRMLRFQLKFINLLIFCIIIWSFLQVHICCLPTHQHIATLMLCQVCCLGWTGICIIIIVLIVHH